MTDPAPGSFMIHHLHRDERSAVCRADESLQHQVPLYSLICPLNTNAGFQPSEEQLLAGFIGGLLP